MHQTEITPYTEGVHFHFFEAAYRLHMACMEIYKAQMPAPDVVDTMSPALLEQRKAITDICIRILMVRRDKELDSFCTAWLQYRKLPIYFTRPTNDPQTGTEAVGGGGSRSVAGPLHAPLSGPRSPSPADDSSHHEGSGDQR